MGFKKAELRRHGRLVWNHGYPDIILLEVGSSEIRRNLHHF
ncbi:hypothetical protein T10_13326 [Trichinella papuae]|uniref:Uncharacterized protein n=1 Tax=Trichinella papuae TaxID=268474 RepID=A0A0V1M0T8_9BILA|nr:hypothetical protein T10_13326 [Trichinella papuae]